MSEEPYEKITRHDAVRILMDFERAGAKAGHVELCKALEMAIRTIVKRHRDHCRSLAKRRAAQADEAAKEGK